MPMNPRLLVPRATAHPEASAWRSLVVANGGSVSATTLRAVSNFCAAIDAAGIRDRFARVNLFCGDSLNAALVPLYRSFTFGGQSLGNATDTNNAFVGVGTDYAETGAGGGLQGNGTSKRLDTGLNQDDIVDPPLTGHMSIYDMGFAVAGTTVPMGSYTLTTAAQRFSIERRTTGRVGGYGSGGIYA